MAFPAFPSECREIFQNFQKNFLGSIDILLQVWYNVCTTKEREVSQMDKVRKTTKELIKLFQQLNKLAIEIISLVGWLIILIEVLS